MLAKVDKIRAYATLKQPFCPLRHKSTNRQIDKLTNRQIKNEVSILFSTNVSHLGAAIHH